MLEERLKLLRTAARVLAAQSADVRSGYLKTYAEQILAHRPALLKANQEDLRNASGVLNDALMHRLELSSTKIDDLAAGILQLAAMEDPIGKVQLRTELDDGLILERVSVPLGVFLVIFESRPDVGPQVAALALRSGNGVVLKGGSEAKCTNIGFMEVLTSISKEQPTLPTDWALLLEGREAVAEALQHRDLIDLVIPRGSNELVISIMEQSSIPVLGHADGVCHLYVHPSANQQKALKIILDAKTQYPAACNSIETLLVDQHIAENFLPLVRTLADSKDIKLRLCKTSAAQLGSSEVVPDDGWRTEYGNRTLAVRVVADVDAAIGHINEFGSHHTDVIVAADEEAQNRFLTNVDSACVFVNCSTRFADGYRFGFGAEIGIGTGKIHARGPVGIEGLLTYKYLLRGDGHVVASYTGEDARRFRHRRL